MTTKQKIKIEGLPEGYEVSKVTVEEHGIARTWKEGERMAVRAEIKLRKIKRRRVVLEETDQFACLGSIAPTSVGIGLLCTDKIWREVKEGE